MLESYEDIRKRIPEPPKWWDCNGVPRYDEFHPRLSPNVYATEVLLYEIACQSCGTKFLVEENWSRYLVGIDVPSLADRVMGQRIHFGDPPCWDENCAAGATENCLDLRTVEFWRQVNLDWERVPELEGLPLGDYGEDAA